MTRLVWTLPDGSQTARWATDEGGGGGSLPAGWVFDEDGNLKITASDGSTIYLGANAGSGALVVTTFAASPIATLVDGDENGLYLEGGLAYLQATSGLGLSSSLGANDENPSTPVIPASPDAQDIADALVALGLATQA